jgi:hypothetical protein
MYYFIIVVLLYTLVKGLLVAFGQGSGTGQAIGFVIVDAALLIATSVMRPYMDKKTNAFNISIAAVNFFNALLLLFFTQVFNLPVRFKPPSHVQEQQELIGWNRPSPSASWASSSSS